MPRHPDNAIAREWRITVRLSNEERATLERKRGPEDRSDFIRGLIDAAPTRKDTTDAPND